MADDLPVSARLTIPGGELELTFTTSPGPGGQNVNRVHTRAVLRWDVAASGALGAAASARLRALAGSRITNDGVVVLASSRHRTQARNLAEVRGRLADLVRRALTPPTPRLPTGIPGPARRRRLEDKRRRAEIKRRREPIRGAD